MSWAVGQPDRYDVTAIDSVHKTQLPYTQSEDAGGENKNGSGRARGNRRQSDSLLPDYIHSAPELIGDPLYTVGDNPLARGMIVGEISRASWRFGFRRSMSGETALAGRRPRISPFKISSFFFCFCVLHDACVTYWLAACISLFKTEVGINEMRVS